MENSLPRNGKEGFIFGSIICSLTCIVMGTLNISINMGGLTKEVFLISLKAFPIIFVIAMLIEEMLVGRIAKKLVEKFTDENDSFNAVIMFRIFFTVMAMSIIMTIVGGILSGGIRIQIINEFIKAWPRNFCIAFLLELCVVQPFARKIMRVMHSKEITPLIM